MHVRTFLSGAGLVAAIAPIAASQVTITPMAGGYIAASNVGQVSSGAKDLVRSRDGTLSLGANIDFGMLRGTFAYASGTTIKSASSQELGKGSMFATTADLVVRPLARARSSIGTMKAPASSRAATQRPSDCTMDLAPTS
jgi:hypothetical protein